MGPAKVNWFVKVICRKALPPLPCQYTRYLKILSLSILRYSLARAGKVLIHIPTLYTNYTVLSSSSTPVGNLIANSEGTG